MRSVTLTLEGIMSGTSNTAIGDDARRFLVDGSGNVCVGDEAGTGLGSACISLTARRTGATIAELKSTVAQQQKGMEALTRKFKKRARRSAKQARPATDRKQ